MGKILHSVGTISLKLSRFSGFTGRLQLFHVFQTETAQTKPLIFIFHEKQIDCKNPTLPAPSLDDLRIVNGSESHLSSKKGGLPDFRDLYQTVPVRNPQHQ
ncbi:hypothetical protein BOX24_05255 [Leptospirillum ferriphilum]|uniref:Uncharacterized protein n=1 Tax=Leptospirillum ferriphilum TaxID=178606 RepID=A0A1V3SWD4_9BACT|nr:hypothetical protein BOX24_05255 [Leptospirillum ferriphilum]